MTALHATHTPSQPPAWPLTSTLTLAALPGATPCARLHTRLVVTEWGMPGTARDAELITSELTTNAIQATTRPPRPASPVIHLRLLSDRTRLLIEVADPIPFPPRPAPPAAPGTETGRGLIIVNALSHQWGTRRVPGWPGKITWSELRPRH